MPSMNEDVWDEGLQRYVRAAHAEPEPGFFETIPVTREDRPVTGRVNLGWKPGEQITSDWTEPETLPEIIGQTAGTALPIPGPGEELKLIYGQFVKGPQPVNPVSSKDAIADCIYDILRQFPLDLEDENFVDTPQRVATSLVDEILAGYRQDPEDFMKVFPNTHAEEGLVIESDIPFFSTCAHHFLPFFGKAAVAYVPNKKVLGLSKFARVVDCFARRLQLQEHITTQVASCIEERLDPLGCMVILYDVTHLCVCSRGVHSIGSKTQTSVVRGSFRNVPALREEALTLIFGR